MTPADAIAGLDRMLAAAGSTATLRRLTGSGENQAAWDAEDVPAKVREYRPDPLVPGGDPQQGRRIVILSPTGLAARGWPVGGGDPQRGDHVLIAGAVLHVEAVRVTRLAGSVVRYDLEVLG